MRRTVIVVVSLAVLLAACGSDKKQGSSAATTSSTAAASTTTRAATTTTRPAATSTSAAATTTAACPNTGSTDPRATLAAQPSALLTNVVVTTAGCRDSVTFTFRTKGSAVPSCAAEYRTGPFTRDGSGAAVAVAGTAFLAVRCTPAYGYDFETGTTTYTGSKNIIPAGTRHVRAVVETGDFEGVVNWVIGLDTKRAFAIDSSGAPREFVVTFS
jgi:hypothetical protein